MFDALLPDRGSLDGTYPQGPMSDHVQPQRLRFGHDGNGRARES